MVLLQLGQRGLDLLVDADPTLIHLLQGRGLLGQELNKFGIIESS